LPYPGRTGVKEWKGIIVNQSSNPAPVVKRKSRSCNTKFLYVIFFLCAGKIAEKKRKKRITSKEKVIHAGRHN